VAWKEGHKSEEGRAVKKEDLRGKSIGTGASKGTAKKIRLPEKQPGYPEGEGDENGGESLTFEECFPPWFWGSTYTYTKEDRKKRRRRKLREIRTKHVTTVTRHDRTGKVRRAKNASGRI